MKKNANGRPLSEEKDSYRRSEMEFGVAAEAYRSDPTKRANRNGATMFSVVLALISVLAVTTAWYAVTESLDIVAVAVAAAVGIIVLSSVHVCME